MKTLRPKVAYVKEKSSDKYLLNPDGTEYEVDIDSAIRVSRDNPKKHKTLRYMTLNPNIQERKPLKVHTVHEQFERLELGDCESEFDQYYDESMSHKCAIDALSQLKEMKFKLRVNSFKHGRPNHLINHVKLSKYLTFNFATVEKTPYLKLPNNQIYYPDLLCTFEEDHEFFDRWGGKLAIEVTYAHECEKSKLEDYLFHNIPVIEVRIDRNSPRQFPPEKDSWPASEPWGLDDALNHTNDLKNWFSEYISADLIVDPVSTRIHRKEIGQLYRIYKDEQQVSEDLREQLNEKETKNCELAGELEKWRIALQHKENEKQNTISRLNDNIGIIDKENIWLTRSLTTLFVFVLIFLISPVFTPETIIEIVESWLRAAIKIHNFLFS